MQIAFIFMLACLFDVCRPEKVTCPAGWTWRNFTSDKAQQKAFELKFSDKARYL
jgi:hypothetical protein